MVCFQRGDGMLRKFLSVIFALFMFVPFAHAADTIATNTAFDDLVRGQPCNL